MAIYEDLVSKARLKVFLNEIKKHFPVSVNGVKPDSNGNVNIANMTGASTSSAGKAGLAPAPAAGAANRYLRSDGTWQIPPDNDTKYNNMTAATASAAGKAGLVPAPAAGMQNKFLCADATWKDAGGLPVGHEFFTTNPNIPAGCIPLLGGEYSRTAYADLWAWVQTQQGYLIEESAWQAKADANGGNVPFYSKGNGSTTFRVPALKCWVKGANSISEVGGYLAAGLPNIEGSINSPANYAFSMGHADSQGDITVSGAFANSVKGGYSHTGSVSNFNNRPKNIVLNASLSNPIYGASDTVQPPSIVGLWVVKAYGTITNVGSTDVADIATGLTEAETRISALENHGAGATVVESYRNGTEWYRVWSDGWIEQGGSITTALQDTTRTVTLLKVMADTNYQTYATSLMPSASHANVAAGEKTVENFKVSVASSFQYGSTCVEWLVIGQGA